MALPNRKRKIADEGRKFHEDWEIKYFCSELNGKITCLICKAVISAAKEYNVKRHYTSNHGKQYDSHTDEIREEKLNLLKTTLYSQQESIRKFVKSNQSVTKASYEICYLLAKHSKPFSDGSIIKECMLKAVECLIPEKTQVFREISLSRNTVVDRISEIADNISHQQRSIVQRCLYFSLAVDESTDIRDTAQVAVFFRACSENMEITEELLELIPLHDTTTGDDIYRSVWDTLIKYDLPFEKLASITTDGAKAMTGNTKGIIARISQKLQELHLN